MTREQIHIGDMSHETAIGILKLMLEAMETYDGISPTTERINAVKMAIESLAMPSVTPQEPKTGHWIALNDDYLDWYECSECGYGSEGEMQYSSEYDVRTNYCPCCGAKMAESEDT